MFQEFNEGVSGGFFKEKTSSGLADQFQRLENHGNSVSDAAVTIQDLLDRLQDSAFLKECKTMLETLERK